MVTATTAGEKHSERNKSRGEGCTKKSQPARPIQDEVDRGLKKRKPLAAAAEESLRNAPGQHR